MCTDGLVAVVWYILIIMSKWLVLSFVPLLTRDFFFPFYRHAVFAALMALYAPHCLLERYVRIYIE